MKGYKSKQNKGITLIAMVVTIIILLILAGTSVSMIAGKSGILTKGGEAATKGKKGTYDEELKMMGSSIKMDQELEGLSSKEVIDRYEEQIKKEGVFEGSTLDRVSANKLKVTTKEGYVFEINEGEKITDAIPSIDYGTNKETKDKYIKYPGQDINGDGQDDNDWRIFYNDGTNVFIIAADYVKKEKVPASTGMNIYDDTNYHYSVNWDDIPATKLSDLKQTKLFMYSLETESTRTNAKCAYSLLNTKNWSSFVNGTYATAAVGGSTAEMWVASWNAHSDNTKTGNPKLELDPNGEDRIWYWFGIRNESGSYFLKYVWRIWK